MTSVECGHCGATVKNAAARFCEFCGTEIVRPDAPRAETPHESRRTTFELLRGHPELERALVGAPSARTFMPNDSALGVAAIVGGLAFVVFWIAMAAQLSALFALFGLVVLGTFAAQGVKMLNRNSRYRAARVEGRPAIVVDERTQVTGGGNHNVAKTRYYATLEFEDGSRRELHVYADQAGNLAHGDAGVAFVKHEALIGFRRIPV